MSLTMTSHAAATSLPGSAYAERPGLLARLLTAAAREIRIRRDLRLLASLDDAALHDIGLTRGGMEDAVRHGRSQHDGLPVFKPMASDRTDPAAEWR